MLKIRTSDGDVDIPVDICQISGTIKKMHEDESTNVIDLPEIETDVMITIKDFYYVYNELEDSTKLKFNDSVTVPDGELKDHYSTFSDTKLITTLDISKYLNIDPLTNLLASVVANKIQKNHKF